MPSPRAVLPFAFVLLFASGCPDKPAGGDEADSTAETDAATDTTDTGEACEDRSPGEFFSYSLVINGAPILDEDIDIDRECTIYDDEGDPKLTLDCGDFGFELTLDGEPGEAIPAVDVVGANVQLHFEQNWLFNYADRWLRVDFLGEDLSVYVIDAAPLEPASGWISPWGLAVGLSCLVDPSIDQVAESLVLEREGEMLELWQGESGQLGADVEVWVDRSLRDGPDAPAGDGPPSWKELAIVSHQPPP